MILTRSATSLLLCCTLLCGCGQQTADQEASQPVIRPTAPDAIVRGTLLSKSGDTLEYRYDNQAHTMTIHFKNLSSELRQDTSASGIRYSNDEFVYSEWHGISTLKQKGTIVFETSAPVK